MTTNTVTCSCTPTTEETHSGVTVTGHQLATCLQGEPRQYVWKEAGRLQVGSLAGYANSWECSQYDGTHSDLGLEVLVWGDLPVVHRVEVAWLRTDEDGFRWFRLVVGNEACVITVDPRDIRS